MSPTMKNITLPVKRSMFLLSFTRNRQFSIFFYSYLKLNTNQRTLDSKMALQSHNFVKRTIAIWSRSCVKEDRPRGVLVTEELLKTKVQSTQININQQTIKLKIFFSNQGIHCWISLKLYSANLKKRLYFCSGFPAVVQFVLKLIPWTFFEWLPAPHEQKHPSFV